MDTSMFCPRISLEMLPLETVVFGSAITIAQDQYF